MSDIATKLTTIAENQQKVYDKGRQDEYDAFWDVLQLGKDNLQSYAYAFCSWSSLNIRPKYNLVSSDCSYMFYNTAEKHRGGAVSAYNLVEVLNNVGVSLDTSQCSKFNYMFYRSSVTRVPSINLASAVTAGLAYYIFANCMALRTIDELIVDIRTIWNSSIFAQCTALTSLKITGTIGQNGFSVGSSSNLTTDSLMSIINALADYSEDTSGTTWKVTIGSANKAKLTDEELQIAYDKGWTVS